MVNRVVGFGTNGTDRFVVRTGKEQATDMDPVLGLIGITRPTVSFLAPTVGAASPIRGTRPDAPRCGGVTVLTPTVQ